MKLMPSDFSESEKMSTTFKCEQELLYWLIWNSVPQNILFWDILRSCWDPPAYFFCFWMLLFFLGLGLISLSMETVGCGFLGPVWAPPSGQRKKLILPTQIGGDMMECNNAKRLQTHFISVASAAFTALYLCFFMVWAMNHTTRMISTQPSKAPITAPAITPSPTSTQTDVSPKTRHFCSFFSSIIFLYSHTKHIFLPGLSSIVHTADPATFVALHWYSPNSNWDMFLISSIPVLVAEETSTSMF